MQEEAPTKVDPPPPKDEIKNFPDEMGVPMDENWADYSKFERNPKDSKTMARIWSIFSARLFPVLSLSYVASVLGICLNNGTHFLTDGNAHFMALIITMWVGIAPFTWTCMRATIGEFEDQANTWYLWIAGLQGLCGLAFYFMFPTNLGPWLWGFQSFFVASIPIHIVVYIFFMARAMPSVMTWPLSLIGIIFMVYGILFA